MIDQQLYNYLRVSQQWHREQDNRMKATQPEKRRKNFHVTFMNQFGKWMVNVGQYLQRIAEPSHQTAKQFS